MEAKIPTRMGDGFMVEMTRSELRADLEDATREAALYSEFDYVVVNDELESAAADLIAIVRAARRRRERCDAQAAGIVATFPRLAGR